MYYPEHAGPLSIICNFGGAGEYLLRKQRYVVDDSSYLILNQGRRSATVINADHDVELFHIWFHHDFAVRVLRDMVVESDQLLDDPELDTSQPVLFFEKIYRHDAILSPMLMRIRSVIRANLATDGWEEEQYHLLLERMLGVHRTIGVEIDRIPGVRRSTRVEIYRRLHEAKDFIDANFAQKLTLNRIAGTAFMSSHHFLRLFRQVFGITPHQYLTQRRLEHACRLLSESSLSIAEVCRQVGFTSHGSFSWMFRRRMQRSPEEYRVSTRA